MRTAWEVLVAGGLPLALERVGSDPSAADLASSARAAIAEQPTGRDREALAALVFAWQHHWPQVFARELGGDAAPILAWASAAFSDVGRYLTLRRIANLATVL